MAKVFIGVGHGGSNPGAVSAGLVEKDINLVMALAMGEELQRHGVNVLLSRTKDEEDSLSQEIAKCNAFAPDLAVEVHNNAGGGDGFEVYVYPGATKARQLATCIEAEVKALGQNSRGIKESATLGRVRQVKAPAVLCEGFFLDNAADRLIADTTEKQKRFGVAYAKGTLKMLGIAYQAPVSNLDNTPDEYAKGAVEKAVAKGVLRGDGQGDLRLRGTVTRQDLMVVLERAGVL